MSGYADDTYADDGYGDDDGYGEWAAADTDVAADAADTFEDAYLADPLATIGAAIENTAAQVEARVRAQVEAEVQQAQAERQTTVVREANEAMVEKYGADWGEQVPTVADVLRHDAARGALPTHDALELAQHLERAFLAERERTRPSSAELDAAHWERVRTAPGSTSYADSR